MKELSIFKIKKGYSFTEIIDKEYIFKHIVNDDKKYEVDNLNINGKIYIGHNDQNPPDWIEYIKRLSSEIEDDLMNQSSRAIAILEVAGSVYIITFGQGRYMINDDYIIRNFGRKIVLNLIESDSIKKTQTAAIGDFVTSHLSSASRQTDINDLRINTDSDLLMSIEGEVQLLDLYANAIGRDSIKLTFKEAIDLNLIEQLIQELEHQHSREEYKEKFGWIDNLIPVQDDQTKNEVFTAAIEKYMKEDSNLHLVNADVLEDNYAYSYSITERGSQVDDINDLKGMIKERWTLENTENSLKNILNKYILIHDEDRNDLFKWSFKKTLTGEVSLDDNIYTLFLGNIYEIDKDYAENINKKVQEFQENNNYELDFDICTEDEGIYLENQSRERDYLICLDQKNINYNGSQIEACDLLTDNKELIHVKKWSSSSTLSHLFQQGIVSAQLLMNDRGFRELLNDKIDDDNFKIDIDNYFSADYTIVYSVLFKNDDYSFIDLPIFSKIVLVNSLRELENYSYNVKLNRLQYVTSNDEDSKE